MTFISFNFLFCLLISVIIYYCFSNKIQWLILLIISKLFYLQSGIKPFIIVLTIGLFSYLVALVIEKMEKGKKKFLIISISIVMLLSILAFIKIFGRFESFASKVIIPVGISYFTLSIVGYLLDVYWGKQKAEKNIGHFLTFVFYFPKIIQGPISNYKHLGPQIKNRHAYDYDEVCYGIQLIIWGMFKKIVIADRLLLIVSKVYGDLDTYSQHGVILLITMIVSAFQLYLDFSGYTDMAMGISQMFGIKLEENFNHPFFAKSAAEFWRRWHMSLGTWFKDYLFLPVSRSSFVKKISKMNGEKYGPAARKKTMMVISLIAVWTATAMWHGTGINYFAWGLYWGGIIIFSEVFDERILNINSRLKINTASSIWKIFQIIRTFGIFTFGKMISAQTSLRNVKQIVGSIIKRSHLSDFDLVFKVGMNRNDYIIVIAGLIIVFIVSILQERNIEIRKRISKWNPLFRWSFYVLSVSIVLLLGMYGSGYDVSTFAYAVF